MLLIIIAIFAFRTLFFPWPGVFTLQALKDAFAKFDELLEFLIFGHLPSVRFPVSLQRLQADMKLRPTRQGSQCQRGK